jgi:pimeloyl-ACP methyl ester carboxylesterase
MNMEHKPTNSFAISDGVSLAVASVGSGTPILFLHELAGDLRNWESQMQFFAPRYRCVAFNARGYPPSEVPQDVAQYSQAQAVRDVAAVMRHCEIDRAHVVGLSMGGYTALNFAIAHPDRVRSVVAAGTGHGSDPATRQTFLDDCARLADRSLELGLEAGGADYLAGPTRRRFKEKDPSGLAAFNRQFAEHSPVGTALTIRGCQLRRPTLQDLEGELARLSVPTLVIAGDDDDPCVPAGLLLKRTIADARLCLLPRTTHAVNLEEPDAFNLIVSHFLSDVGGHQALGRARK